MRKLLDNIAPIAIHKDQDRAGGKSLFRARLASRAIATLRGYDARTGFASNVRRPVRRTVIDHDAFSDILTFDRTHDRADRFPFIKCRDDDGHAAAADVLLGWF